MFAVFLVIFTYFSSPFASCCVTPTSLSFFLSFFLWYQREDKLLKTQSTKIQGDFSRETPETGKKDGNNSEFLHFFVSQGVI